MKRLFYLAVLGLLAVACNQTGGELVLKGTGLSVTGDVYVYDIVANVPVDTIAVQDGAFTYTYKIEGEPKLFILTDGQYLTHYLVTEKGNLSLDSDSGSIKGAPLNDRLVEFMTAYRSAGKELEDKKSALIESMGEDQEPSEELINEIQALNKEQGALIAETARGFYQKDKETIVGAIELMFLQGVMDDTELVSLYEQGGEPVKQFKPLAQLVEASANKAKTSVGAMYLDLEGVNPKDESQTMKLSDFAGKDKYVLLDFWASWCGPCRAAMPEIKRLNDTYGNKGLEVLGLVMSDKLEDHLASAEALGVTWTQIFDSKNEFGNIYGIEGIPTLILLDKDGTILVRTHDKEEVVMKIESLLGK